MSTTTPPRPRSLTAGIGLPAVRDVHLPGVIARRPRWLVAGVVLVVLILIAYYLRTKEMSGTLWSNEAIAIGIANQSFGGVLHATRVGGSAPLYYLLLHLWIGVFGNGAATTPGTARDLSLVIALICVPVAGWAGWTLGGERGAFYAAVLFAFSSMLTDYGQSAQPYALLILLGLLATTAFLQAFAYRRRRWLWLLGGSLTAGFYTQGSTGLFLVGLGAALVVVLACAERGQRGAILRDAGLVLAGVVILYIPWIPATIDQIAHATSPWHYAPLVSSFIPSDLVGGQRVDAVLLVLGVLGIGPFVLIPSRRREPEAVALFALIAIGAATILFALVANLAAPVMNSRYLAPIAAVMLLLGALCAARTKLLGVVAVAVILIFCLDPAAFASSHPSNMNEVAAQLGGRLKHDDVVLSAQPEATPLAWYYLPSGLRFDTTIGPVSDPRYMNWDNAQSRLERTTPGPALARIVASLAPGQQLLYIRPLTEGEKNWRSTWATLVRRRAAQWGQLLSQDVASGTLTQVASAPENYPGDCCIANSAVLYRKRAS